MNHKLITTLKAFGYREIGVDTFAKPFGYSLMVYQNDTLTQYYRRLNGVIIVWKRTRIEDNETLHGSFEHQIANAENQFHGTHCNGNTFMFSDLKAHMESIL